MAASCSISPKTAQMECDDRILAEIQLPENYFLPRHFTGDWEAGAMDEDTLPHYVARHGQVLIFCVIGTVRDIALVGTEGFKLPNVYIDIEPHNTMDGKALTKLCKAAGYEEHENDGRILSAGKNMLVRDTVAQGWRVEQFTEVYDTATTPYRIGQCTKRLEPSTIECGDKIVIEGRVPYRELYMPGWKVDFELVRVFLLQKGLTESTLHTFAY